MIDPASSMMLYGIDVNPMAAEFTSFVLLSIAGWNGFPSPWAAWHCNRLNQATGDSLLLEQDREVDEISTRRLAREREDVRAGLMSGLVLPPAALSSVPGRSLADFFPEVATGVDVVLTNPPYAPFGPHPEAKKLSRYFRCLADQLPRPATNVFPLFFEQGWRLLGPNGSMSIVVPLSVMFGDGGPVAGLRKEVARWNADIEFISFDRTPDALFGDDVKTRNTIVTITPAPNRIIRTSGLIRWTSRSRTALFSSIESTRVDEDIEALVPKVSDAHEYGLYRALRTWPHRMKSWTVRSSRVIPSQGVGTSGSAFYVAQTAYNWLNCIADIGALAEHGHSSSCSYNAVETASAERAFASYAIGVSRVAYLLWRIEGDGFHVTKRFIDALPVPVDPKVIRELATLGEEIWTLARCGRVVSTNRGQQSVSFPPLSQSMLDQIDRSLLAGMEIESGFDLESWCRRNVVVDLDDQRRQKLVPPKESVPC
jgi:hypothetical protein